MNSGGKNSMADPEDAVAFVNTFEAPTLLMQTNPWQVVTANQNACRLFNKFLVQIEGHRGGQVFYCIHSFTEKGCGLDPNCEDCKIKIAVVDTFLSGNPHKGIQTVLDVRKENVLTPYSITVSTKKADNCALVTIDEYREKS